MSLTCFSLFLVDIYFLTTLGCTTTLKNEWPLLNLFSPFLLPTHPYFSYLYHMANRSDAPRIPSARLAHIDQLTLADVGRHVRVLGRYVFIQFGWDLHREYV